MLWIITCCGFDVWVGLFLTGLSRKKMCYLAEGGVGGFQQLLALVIVMWVRSVPECSDWSVRSKRNAQ